MLLNARSFGLALVLGAALVLALVIPTRGALQAVEETPAPLPPPVTPTPAFLLSQIPTPVFVQPGQSTPVPGPVCVAQGAFSGGQTFQAMNLRITLPATGTYNVYAGHSESVGTFVQICYVEGDATISFGADGVERRRAFGPAGSAAVANPVLDEIARSVQVLSPQPVLQAPGGGGILPPNAINPPGGPICSAQGAYPGGQIVDALNLRIRLPATGTYNVNFGISDPGGEFIRVCYVEGNAAIFFARDGRETSRRLTDTSSPAMVMPVFDEIARNVQLLSPPPTPQPRCHGRGATTGATHVEIGAIAFDLPPGDFVITRNNDEFATVSICYVQGNVAMLMHTIGCSVLSRDKGLPEANAVLDQIVTSCALLRPPASLRTSPNPQTPIRPPDTGDAGLAAQSDS